MLQQNRSFRALLCEDLGWNNKQDVRRVRSECEFWFGKRLDVWTSVLTSSPRAQIYIYSSNEDRAQRNVHDRRVNPTSRRRDGFALHSSLSLKILTQKNLLFVHVIKIIRKHTYIYIYILVHDTKAIAYGRQSQSLPISLVEFCDKQDASDEKGISAKESLTRDRGR